MDDCVWGYDNKDTAQTQRTSLRLRTCTFFALKRRSLLRAVAPQRGNGGFTREYIILSFIIYIFKSLLLYTLTK